MTNIGKVIEMGFGFDFLVCISSQIWIQQFEMKIYGTTGKNVEKLYTLKKYSHQIWLASMWHHLKGFNEYSTAQVGHQLANTFIIFN